MAQDQTEYGTEFDQINLKDAHDLQSVLSFLKWLHSASDEEFASDLGRWVDVHSLATLHRDCPLPGGPGRGGLRGAGGMCRQAAAGQSPMPGALAAGS